MISGGRYHLEVMWFDKHLVCFDLFVLWFTNCSARSYSVWKRDIGLGEAAFGLSRVVFAKMDW